MKINLSSGLQIVEDLIKLRWVPEILKSVNLGNSRYTDIQRSIDGISHTELNRKLTILIEKGAILRDEDENNISYGMLEFGQDLVHIFNHLEDLQEKYYKVG